MYQRPIQSVNSFKSYRANKLLVNTQTDTFVKRASFFRVQWVSKREDLTKKKGGGVKL